MARSTGGLWEQIRDVQVKAVGPDHPTTLTTQGNLAAAYREAGRSPEAIALFEQVRAARVQKFGAEHRATLATLDGLAMAKLDAGKVAEAITLLEQVRDVWVKQLGADHPSTLATLHNLATACTRTSGQDFRGDCVVRAGPRRPNQGHRS